MLIRKEDSLDFRALLSPYPLPLPRLARMPRRGKFPVVPHSDTLTQQMLSHSDCWFLNGTESSLWSCVTPSPGQGRGLCSPWEQWQSRVMVRGHVPRTWCCGWAANGTQRCASKGSQRSAGSQGSLRDMPSIRVPSKNVCAGLRETCGRAMVQLPSPLPGITLSVTTSGMFGPRQSKRFIGGRQLQASARPSEAACVTCEEKLLICQEIGSLSDNEFWAATYFPLSAEGFSTLWAQYYT